MNSATALIGIFLYQPRSAKLIVEKRNMSRLSVFGMGRRDISTGLPTLVGYPACLMLFQTNFLSLYYRAILSPALKLSKSMSTYNYAPGAYHFDIHHNNIAVSVPQIMDLVRTFISDQAEDIPSPVSPESNSGSSSAQRGPKTQILFADEYGNENLERTRQEAERITKYIADHRLGHMRLDSKRTNKLNLLVACFWYRWDERDWVAPNPQGAAIYRFITEQCHIPCDVQQRAFTSTICALINERKKDPEIYDNLCTYFPK